MIGWHHQLNGHEFEQTLGDTEGQGSRACCSPWGCRVRHDLVTEQHSDVIQHEARTISNVRFDLPSLQM